MRAAVIDLGTNTFNLLVFDKNRDEIKIIHKDRVPVNLGMGGINENKITLSAFKRGVDTICFFNATCNHLNVTRVDAFGTSALRGANNANAFISEIKKNTGITVSIIDGSREAELIYHGVKSVHNFTKKSCIMDIGGGSTEFIIADDNKIHALESFDIGVSRIIQKFDLSDPLSQEDIKQLEVFLDDKTEGFFSTIQCDTLIGASGSFDTYYELIFNSVFTEERQSVLLTFSKLQDHLNQLIQSTQKMRNENPKITDVRKNMIHVAAFKTRWVIQKLNVNEVWLSPASLKEGVMAEM